MSAVRNRSGLLVRLVGRCETAAAMPTPRARSLRLLRLVLVAALLATWLLPGRVAAASGPAPGAAGDGALGAVHSGARGAGDSGALWFPRSATLPFGGPNSRGVALPRGPLAARPVAALPRGPAAGPREVRARYAVLVDPATGAVLWGRRRRALAPPASLTKMLTALAVRASLDLDEVTVASRKAARQPARRLAMRRGQKLTVDQALKALMIVSANDVAVMLAETAGGSVARFSRAMDAESALLGLRASSWRNPNGLDARGHRSTAFDLAILARAVLQDRWLARVARMRHDAFTTPNGRKVTLTARSRFLGGYRGAVGVKTGFTDDAGHCLAAAATRGGRTLIAVVLRSPDNAADAGRMLDWGFAHRGQAGTGVRLPEPVRPASVAARPGPSSATTRPSPERWPRPGWPGSAPPRRPARPGPSRPGRGGTASVWRPAPAPSSPS